MVIRAIKPREKWYLQRYDLRKRRESKGMMMREGIWFCTLFCVLFGNKNLIQKIKNHQFVAVTLIENMCFIAFWWFTALYQKHRSVRGNHTWVFDKILNKKIIKILIQSGQCSNIILLPWFRCKNEQYGSLVRGTKSREKCYFLNIND